jgi:hypothetical protein
LGGGGGEGVAAHQMKKQIRETCGL